MPQLLRGFLLDLLARCETLQGLVAVPTIPILAPYQQQALALLSEEARKLEELLADPALLHPQIVGNHHQLYQKSAKQISLVESHLVVALTRYGEADRYLHQIVAQAVREIGYPLPCPLVTAISSEYYWAHKGLRLIGLPIAERYTLLSWVDLFHELAHLLYGVYSDILLDDFHTQLSRHFEAEKQRVHDENRPTQYLKVYQNVYTQWRGNWLSELTADLIATFVVGAAYGWGNLKLCYQMRDQPFYPGPDDAGEETYHPADDARMKAVLVMLRHLGQHDQAAILTDHWHKYLTVLAVQPPADYHHCYPEKLLAALAENVHHGCQELGLIGITQQQTNGSSLVLPVILNKAWEHFIADAQTYHQWERQSLAQLGARLSMLP